MSSVRQQRPPPLAVAYLLATAAGCTPLTDTASCADGCPRNQTCDLASQLCVDVRPEVTIVAPLLDAGVDGGQVAISGSVRFFDDAGARSVGALLPDGGFQNFSLDAGAFSALVPVPLRAGESYPLTVRAVDTADRTGEATVLVWLDQVGPTGVFTPSAVARSAEPVIRIVFDEPVSPAGPTPVIELVPDAGPGSFRSSTVYEISGLAFLTTYTARVSAGSVVDVLGNPGHPAGPVVFTTGASPPANTVLLNAGQVLDVDAASDEDGVVTVVARSDGGTVSLFAWGTFDGRTGEFRWLDQSSDAAADVFQAVAGSIADGGVPVLRTTGFFKGSQSSATLRSAAWQAGGTPGSQSTGALALVPTGPSCLEPPGADPVGLVVAGSPELYQRSPGSLALPTSILPARLAVRSADGWELLGVRLGALDRVVFRPTCPPDGSAPFLSQPQFRGSVRSLPRLSVALPDADRSLYVYDAFDGTRVEACDACVGASSGAGCPQSADREAPPGFTVATRRSGGRVLGAALDGGVVELFERDLTDSCAGAWQSLGTLPRSAGATHWVPVLFGARPGAVWATPTQVAADVLP